MTDAENRRAHSPDDEPRWMRVVRPFIDDESLRPVLFALVGHVAIIIVPIMLSVWRTQNLAAVGALILLLVGSVMLANSERQIRGRLGAFTVVTVLTWLGSVGLTWVCYVTNVL